MKICRKNKYT